MPLFDAHLHLQDERINQSIDTILKKASEAGVKGFLCCGSMVEDWQDVLEISRNWPAVIPAFGLHPWYVEMAPKSWPDLLKEYLICTPSVVGEIGLDVMFRKKTLELQLRAFEIQLALAVELKRPVSVHCLKAWHHLIPIIERYRRSGVTVQLHAYSGGPEQIEKLTDLGCYFSFTGAITRENSKKLRASITRVPQDRLLLETDSPDIPLQIDGKIDKTIPNQPANLPLVLRQAARLLEKDESVLAAQTWDNTIAFLGQTAGYFNFKDLPLHDSRTV